MLRSSCSSHLQCHLKDPAAKAFLARLAAHGARRTQENVRLGGVQTGCAPEPYREGLNPWESLGPGARFLQRESPGRA